MTPPNIPPRLGDPRLPARFWAKVRTDGECWLWTGAKTTHGTGAGYGQYWLDGRLRLAHRVSYTALVGPIPDGLQIDHVCRDRGCARPDHLEPVTGSINTRRGANSEATRARAAAVTHCPAGHEYSPGNTYLDKKATRHCKLCRRARTVLWRQGMSDDRLATMRAAERERDRGRRAKKRLVRTPSRS